MTEKDLKKSNEGKCLIALLSNNDRVLLKAMRLHPPSRPGIARLSEAPLVL